MFPFFSCGRQNSEVTITAVFVAVKEGGLSSGAHQDGPNPPWNPVLHDDATSGAKQAGGREGVAMLPPGSLFTCSQKHTHREILGPVQIDNQDGSRWGLRSGGDASIPLQDLQGWQQSDPSSRSSPHLQVTTSPGHRPMEVTCSSFSASGKSDSHSSFKWTWPCPPCSGNH